MNEKLKTQNDAGQSTPENNNVTPTRGEINRFSPEKSRIEQSIRTLSRYGLLKKIDTIKLFHGRSGDGRNWIVNPDLDNSDNNTGNSNYNQTPGLHTSRSTDLAKEYARIRARRDGGIAEYRRIVSDDPDANIINLEFRANRLKPSELEQVKTAIRQTLPGILEGAPLKFEERDILKGTSPKDFIRSNRDGLIYEEDVTKNARRLKVSESLSERVMSAENTRLLLKDHPENIGSMIDAFVRNQDSIIVRDKKNKEHRVPISKEYLASWFRRMHTVGCRQFLRSATVQHEIDDYFLFDLKSVNTPNYFEKERKKRERRFGEITLRAEQLNSSGSRLTEELIRNLYIKPERLLHLAKKTPGFKEVFESDTGNWEKFPLEEHTETVLRLFDENYADKLPASVLPIMRMALLVHDIGKPQAAKMHDKPNQRKYNAAYADTFMSKNGIGIDNRWLILNMIGDGMDLTSRWVVNREDSARRELYDYCKKTMQFYTRNSEVSDGTVIGFMNMLMVLQTCDSAAYTTRAVTRSKDGIEYYNYGSFNNSLKDSATLGLKNPYQLGNN